jgi:hypothetical protein
VKSIAIILAILLSSSATLNAVYYFAPDTAPRHSDIDAYNDQLADLKAHLPPMRKGGA